MIADGPAVFGYEDLDNLIVALLDHLAEHPSNWPHGNYPNLIAELDRLTRWENTMTDRPTTPPNVLDEVTLDDVTFDEIPDGPVTPIPPLPPHTITLKWNDEQRVTLDAADLLNLPDHQFRAIVIATWTGNIEQEPTRTILRTLLQ